MDQPQFTVQTETLKPDYGKFVIEPLPQGYGNTLGNALRRILYSSIPGAAITSVTIAGVNHQFTTLSGMREDIVQLILALKQIHVSYTGDKPVHISLSAKGPTEITAGNFDTPADVTITNPELVIAHLADKDAKLEITATIEAGLGYSPADDRKSTTIGVIPIDASFTPVMRVNYEVSATRVGRVTNFDKLVMEIYTDSTVSPESALHQAADTLVSYFSNITHPLAGNAASSPSGSSVIANAKPTAGSTVSLEELDLPTRIFNALQKAGFESVADLIAVPREELAKVKNLGGKSVKIIEAALKERGFELS